MKKSDNDNVNQDCVFSPDSSPVQKSLEQTDSLAALKQIAPGEIIIGTLTGIDTVGAALVNYPDAYDQDINAISTVEISRKHIGRQVALLFANGDPTQPVIMGLIHSPLQDMLENFEISLTESVDEESDYSTASSTASSTISSTALSHEETLIDGKRIVLEGKEEIVLKCGDASITLTKEGKITLRGKYLLNRSSGVNRILGSSVQVN